MYILPTVDVPESASRRILPQYRRSIADTNSVTHAPGRVRVIRGPLTGLVGSVVSTLDPDRWLVATEHPGVMLRINPQLLESLPATYHP